MQELAHQEEDAANKIWLEKVKYRVVLVYNCSHL